MGKIKELDREQFLKAISSGDGSVFLNLKDLGSYQVRFIGMAEEFWTHWYTPIGLTPPSEDFPKTALCLKTFGEECPLCAYSSYLLEDTSEKAQQDGQRLKASHRFMWYCIYRGKLEKDQPYYDSTGGQPFIYEAGVELQGALQKLYNSWGDFSSVKDGYDIEVVKFNAKNRVNYAAEACTESQVVDNRRSQVLLQNTLSAEEIIEVEKLPDFASLRKPCTYDELVALLEFNGVPVSDFLFPIGENASSAPKQLGRQPVGRTATQPPVGRTATQTDVPVAKPASQVVKRTPKCFGTYDAEDAENCNSEVCGFVEECIAKTQENINGNG